MFYFSGNIDELKKNLFETIFPNLLKLKLLTENELANFKNFVTMDKTNENEQSNSKDKDDNKSLDFLSDSSSDTHDIEESESETSDKFSRTVVNVYTDVNDTIVTEINKVKLLFTTSMFKNLPMKNVNFLTSDEYVQLYFMKEMHNKICETITKFVLKKRENSNSKSSNSIDNATIMDLWLDFFHNFSKDNMKNIIHKLGEKLKGKLSAKPSEQIE